jgi:hypothetical protein
MSVKQTPVNNTVEDAIEDGYQTLEDLRDEVQEGLENQRDHPGIAATARFQTMEETAGILDEIVDNRPDWPASFDEDLTSKITCTYTQNRDRRISRSGRRDNGAAALQAGADALRAWADDEEERAEAVVAGGEAVSAEDIKKALDGRDPDTVEDQITEARELADTLEGHANDAEAAEFPGMRG